MDCLKPRRRVAEAGNGREARSNANDFEASNFKVGDFTID
jgi:hypothetical protein